MANNKTVFDRLTTIFSNGVTAKPKSNKYYMDKEVFVTKDKEEYESELRTAHQQKYLDSNWAKVDSELYQQSLHYETTRIGSYSDFEAMEFYPEIAAALDIYMEESVTTNSKGDILNIFSGSERVKKILIDLFVNRLNIHTSLPMWTRNIAKYGDNFLYLNIDSDAGVVGAKQMPNFEMERVETDLYSNISRFNNISDSDSSNEDSVGKLKFLWKGRDIEFKPWQITHFRLLGDDRKLPYGTSLLEKARRIWKQLILSEDAMLIYRVTRAPERRVYKIYVGNIDDADVGAYVNEIANKFKRKPVIDPQTGQMDVKYNQMPVWKDSPIPLLDGRTITIEELAKEYDEGKVNEVYSVQDETHQIVGGKVVWCGKNYTADRMVKVWLDDNTYVVTAEEHPFIMRDGSRKRADELLSGDSLMPFYKKINLDAKSPIGKYEQVYNPNSGKFEKTHRLIAEEILKADEKYNTVHHKNFNKYDNSSVNLEWVDFFEHKKMHSELAKSQWADKKHRDIVIPKIRKAANDNWEAGIYDNIGPKISTTLRGKYENGELEHVKEVSSENLTNYNRSEAKRAQNIKLAKEQNWASRFVDYNNSKLHRNHNEIRREAQLKDWSDPQKRALRSKNMRIVFDEFIWEGVRKNIINGEIKNRKTLIEYLNTTPILDHVISINNNRRLEKQRRIDRTVIQRLLKDKGFDNITEYISENKKNHKVTKIEFIGGDDVYCMTVVGPNGEDDRHNFATLSFGLNGDISKSGVFVANSQDQDFFIPVRSENAPNPIETLPGATNLDAISDIAYLQGKLFAALRVPKPFLGFEDAAGEGKNLALQDIRFSRTINRLQQAVIQGLNQIAIIHLQALGFSDDLDNFSLTLNNPSTQAEMLKIEQMQTKLNVYQAAVGNAGNGFGAMSMTRARKEILGMNADEIKQDLLEQRIEKAAATELEKTSEIIKKTGYFDVVDNIYGDPLAQYSDDGEEESGDGGSGDAGGDAGFGVGGGGFGGGDLGGEDFGGEGFGDEAGVEDFGVEGGEEAGEGGFGEEDITNEEGDFEIPEEPATTEESINRKKENLILESNKIKNIAQRKLEGKQKKYSGLYFDRLVNSVASNKTNKSVINEMELKNKIVNSNIDNIIDNLDDAMDGL